MRTNFGDMYIVQNEDGTKVEYRIWNPFRSKLAAAVLGGVDNIWIVSDFVLLSIIFYLTLSFRSIILTSMFSIL